MDVSKYHTIYPPKEHEEAVRMLLEGLESRPHDNNETLQRRRRVTRETDCNDTNKLERTRPSKRIGQTAEQQPERKMPPASINTKVLTSKMKDNARLSSSSVDSGSLARCSGDQDDEFDFGGTTKSLKTTHNDTNVLEFNSEESSLQEFVQISPQIQDKRKFNGMIGGKRAQDRFDENHVRYPLPKMQSKSTSTASDSISTSGASSADRAENKLNEDDLNGNYEAIPSRTIAIQCDLKLSSVKRDGYLDSASTDLASMQASSISSTRYGFYRLSPEVLEQRRQLARSVSSRNIADYKRQQSSQQQSTPPVRRNTAEAPTSISELSSCADIGEFEPELARVRQRSLSRDPPMVELQSVASSDRDSIAARSKHDQRFFSQRQRQQQVNSRTRQDSLPRRPKTALSHVSASRLRGQQDSGDVTPNRSLSDDDMDDREERYLTRPTSETGNQRMLARNRAMSQQVLSTSAKREPSRRDATLDLVNSNSDSELGAETHRVPKQEELIITKRGRAMCKSPQISRSTAIRDGPLFRRNPTINGTVQQVTGGSALKHSSRYEHEQNTDELNYGQSQAYKMREDSLDQRTRAKLQSGKSYLTDEENQLTTTRRRAILSRQTGHDIAQGPRYNSMSLSRRPQGPLIDKRSCTLNHSEEISTTDDKVHSVNGGMDYNGEEGAEDSNSCEPATFDHRRQSARPLLSHRDRAGSQQALPISGTLGRTTSPRMSHLTATRTGSNQCLVNRSSSMKQGTRSRAALGNDKQNASQQSGSETYQLTEDVDRYQRHHYDKEKRCECEDCYELETFNGQTRSARNNNSHMMENHEFEHDRKQQQRLAGTTNRLSSRLDDTPTKRSESEDSESPLTRTWANPASSHAARRHTTQTTDYQAHKLEDTPVEYSYRTRFEDDQQEPTEVVVGNKVLDRRSSRSHSMRDVNNLETNHNSMLLNGGTTPRRFETIYRTSQEGDGERFLANANFKNQNRVHDEMHAHEDYSVCSSSLEDSCGPDGLTQVQTNHQQLDFDSQQRLNEIGLPEPTRSTPSTKKRHSNMTGSASHLGLSSVSPGLINRYATSGRTGTTSAGEQQQYQHYTRQPGPAITGRAMSQQSLTRPTMPLSRRLRRSGGTIGAGSGSDVGGSSISLVSRLRDGSRYENAHTRNPVVMLIPQVSAFKQNDPLRSSTRRASSRLGRPLAKTSSSRVSSQDRKGRSVSRNGSDSESSSSMLRTLIKPRSNAINRGINGTSNGRGSRRRGTAGNNLDLDEENQDEIGQLASEIDSYKFRRRYSVPKDAKINWFSKLKQRVTSSKG